MTMNKFMKIIQANVLTALKRERREVIGTREKELAKIDTRIMLVKRGAFKLNPKTKKRQVKAFKELRLAFVIIGDDDEYLASWDVHD